MQIDSSRSSKTREQNYTLSPTHLASIARASQASRIYQPSPGLGSAGLASICAPCRVPRAHEQNNLQLQYMAHLSHLVLRKR